MFKSVHELCSVVSHLIYCHDDRTYLLKIGSQSTNYELPSIKSPSTSSWYSNSNKDLQDIFGTKCVIPKKHTLRIYKTWIPDRNDLNEYFTLFHVVYGIRCQADLKRNHKNNNSSNKYRNTLKWLSAEDIVRIYQQKDLISPEIIDLILIFQEAMEANRGSLRNGALPCKALLQLNDCVKTLPNEFCVNGNLVEITENEVIILRSGNNYSNAQLQIIEAAQFKLNFQYLLYREFLLYCFPYYFMSISTFVKFISELGWPREEIPFLFYAADVHDRFGLSFREFMVVLAAIDPHTNHGGAPAEIRCRFMFRYYDRDHDGKLNYAEFKTCVQHVRKSRKESTELLAVSVEADNSLKDMGLSSNRCEIILSEFLQAVGSLKFRGTSLLFRSTVSVVTLIFDIQERERLAEQKSVRLKKSSNDKSFTYLSSASQNSSGSRLRQLSSDDDYDVAVHTIRLQKSGTLINIDDIFALDDAVSHPNLLQAQINPAKRILSLDTFNEKSLPNEVLKGLRYLVQLNKVTSNMPKFNQSRPPHWGQLDSSMYCRSFIQLCRLVKNQLQNEKRLIEINSPVFVLGDIHGNLSDLLYFEKVLWHFGPSLSPVKMLFLGDYVDRGIYSSEVISYLFAYKIQCPHKLFLLRGNHEIRSIQKLFTFESECCRKYGDSLGRELWEAVNSAFDAMPVAAVIDSKIFCCHGGIPPPWLCPVATAINSIPTSISEPDQQCPLAWELMWNDPVREDLLTETAMIELIANEGFGNNTRRGTAHVFSVEALERFLTINGYSHVIRAHEVAQTGFNVQQNGKLLTVFSSSNYCGGVNEAACVVVDQNKLRMLRLQPD